MPDSSLPDAPSRYVFVYGTLRRGGANDITRLQPAPTWVGATSVQGVLYHLGAYPGLRLQGDGRVCGEVYRITPPLEVVLDRIEGITPAPGDEYAKRELLVEVAGRCVQCLVYEVASWRCATAPRIASGDWMQA
ncbi:MAG: gamma-glutamylcyclotransferase [Burkholderiaceae bacterium]